MKEITQFAEHKLEIWRRPRQRHMHLIVKADGSLRVTCNRRMPKRAILAFLEGSHEFIARRHLEIEVAKKRFPPKQVLSGESWLLGGRPIPLEVIWTWTSKPRASSTEAAIEVKAPLASTREERLAAVHRHYRRLAAKHLPARLAAFSERMGLQPRRVIVRGQKTRWGSCSTTGTISLNWKLMAMPPMVVDYVIVHELAHLRHMNHSPRFWALVEYHFPEWRETKQWLRTHEPEIGAQFRE
jgi:hypothetical protein